MKFCFGFPHRMGLYTAAVMTAVQGLVLIYVSIPLLEGFSIQCNVITSAAERYHLTFVDEHQTPTLEMLNYVYGEKENKPHVSCINFLTITQAFLGFFFLPVICLDITAMIFLTSTLIWQNFTLIVEYLVMEMIIIIYFYLATVNGLIRGYWIFLFVFIFITFMVYLWAVVFLYVRRSFEQQKAEEYFRAMDSKLLSYQRWRPYRY